MARTKSKATKSRPSKAKPKKSKPSKRAPSKRNEVPADELELAERLAERGAAAQKRRATKKKAAAKKKKAAPKKKAPAPKKKAAPPAKKRRRRAPPVVPSRIPPARRAFVYALEYAHEIASIAVPGRAPLTLSIKSAPPRKPGPGGILRGYLWEVIGRFGFRDEVTYVEAGLAVAAWAGALDADQGERLAELMSPGVTDQAYGRIARIYVEAETSDGRHIEYTLGESSPWEYCVASAYDRLYDDNSTRRGQTRVQRPGLVEAYGEGDNASRVVALYIALSSQFGSSASRLII